MEGHSEVSQSTLGREGGAKSKQKRIVASVNVRMIIQGTLYTFTQ